MSTIPVKTMQEFASEGKMPEVLFWVGCAGSFDESAKKVTLSLASILNKIGVEFAVLGTEESCTGDPAKRAGNEFLFQMQAMQNIQVMNGYGIKKIVTACPHCFNIIKNEYPDLGGNYDVLHHTQFLNELIQSGRLKVQGGSFKGKKITFHDPCYLGRGNDEYEAPRKVLESLEADLIELKRCKTKSFCCGAGGAQMFKEPEKGNQDINVNRTQEILDSPAEVVAVGCPFCKIMIKDGVKSINDSQRTMQVVDVAEILNIHIDDKQSKS